MVVDCPIQLTLAIKLSSFNCVPWQVPVKNIQENSKEICYLTSLGNNKDLSYAFDIYQWIDHSRNAHVYECTMSGFGHWNPRSISLGGLRKALLRFWWAISPQVHNHCTGGPGKWWATTGGPGERHWNCGWAEAVKATCNGHQCYTGAMGALLLGHHDHAQNFEQRQNIFSFTIINIFVLCTKRPGVWSTPQVVIKTTLFRQLCT